MVSSSQLHLAVAGFKFYETVIAGKVGIRQAERKLKQH